MQITIEDRTYRVAFEHDRHHWTTLCVIQEAGGRQLFSTGLAACSPQDNFNRAVGRKIALSRAVQRAFPREQRRAFWVAYWSALDILPRINSWDS